MKKLLQWALPAAWLLSGAAAVAEPVIVEMRTAAPDVLVAVMLGNTQGEDGFNSVVDPLDLDPAKWRVNGVQPQAVYRYSLPLDEQRADFSARPYPVTVQHRIYLKLAAPVQEGAAYAVTSPYGPATLQFSSDTAYCESIKVNQVGYSARATSRYANYGVYMGNGGSIQFAALPNYEVIKESTGQLIASGVARYMGNETVTGLQDDPNMKRMFSGEHVYRLGMNSVPSGGLYYVKVAGCGRSRSFGVGDAYTREAAYVAMRGFYHQRCGTALTYPHTEHTRAICHSQIADTRSVPGTDEGVPVPPGTPTRQMWGGHHDAGNFQRLARHQIIPIQLMGYYEAFPENFIDNQYNLPESGNGIPDFVDEAMWAVKSWEKLQIDDTADAEYGGVMAGTVEQPGVGNKRYFGYGNAANNPQVEGTWPVEVKSTATAAGIFAQAARIIRPYNPVYADELLARALRAWAFVKRTANVNLPHTHFMYGALQLYLATGEAEYHEVFKQAARATVIAPASNSFPEVYSPGNMTATGQTAHFISYLLPGSHPRDAAIVAGLRDKLFYNADVGTYMGPMPENEPYPQGVSKFLGWGSGVTQGRYADPVVFAWRLSNDAAKKQLYLNAVSQYADYAMGLNPMGMSFYTGLGWDQPNSPLHMDSYFTKYGLSDGITSEHVGKPIGNVPGFLIMGPAAGVSGWSYQTAVSKKIFPHVSQSMPAMRRFAQGWSMIDSNEGGVETTMWNAAMLGFLHNTGNSAGAVCASPKPLTESQSQACPAGLVGAVVSKRDHVCVGGAWTPTPWQALENTCYKTCTGPQPADETRTLSCPAGQYGAVAEKRTYSCMGGGWTPGAWTVTANTCSVAPPLNAVCEIDRLNNKVTATGLSAMQCVQRNDTNAIGYPSNYAVTLPGAPSDQFDLHLFENIASDGKCSRYSKSVRCVAPEPAKPACHVSPWDGSLQVSGLGTELACVKRVDTGVKALNVRGRAVFAAPAAAGVLVSTFRKTDAAGECADQAGQLACQALPAPAPVCAVQPNGSMLVTGLNDSIACLSRTDVSEQQANVDNRAIFSKGPATSATRILTFKGINAGGACVGQVGGLSCAAPTTSCSGTPPADDTRTLSCETGQVGLLKQKRSYTCSAAGWKPNDWTFMSSTCAPAPAADPVCDVDPAANTVTVRNLGQLACVKRDDTKAIGLPSNQSVVFPGAPGKDFDMLTYNVAAADGTCTGFAKAARCTVPVAARPQCIVNPYDGNLQISGLGTELACVKRNDNGQFGISDRGIAGLPDRGRVTFNGPVPGIVSVTTYRNVSSTGVCGTPTGELSCAAVPKPTPVCVARPDGTLAITGLNAATICLSRTDTGAQQYNVGGSAIFNGAPGSSAMRIYLFSGINGAGACINHVAALACTPGN